MESGIPVTISAVTWSCFQLRPIPKLSLLVMVSSAHPEIYSISVVFRLKETICKPLPYRVRWRDSHISGVPTDRLGIVWGWPTFQRPRSATVSRWSKVKDPCGWSCGANALLHRNLAGELGFSRYPRDWVALVLGSSNIRILRVKESSVFIFWPRPETF